MDTADGSIMSSGTQPTPKKGFKVLTLENKSKVPVGVAASSLSDLVNKACARLKMSRKGVRVCLPDGTLLDKDYFGTLSNQTTVILLRAGESLQTTAVVMLVERLLAAGRGPELHQQLSAMLYRQAVRGVRPDQLVGPAAGSAGPDRAQLSRRTDDPDWFKDLDTASATKEEYMRRRCEGRVRNYFYDSRTKMRSAPATVLPCLEQLMATMLRQLQTDRFHGQYFDRGADNGRLCDDAGQFSCQGAFSERNCGYSEHRANPYRSREERIVFSTWNLDHRIERSRTILPCLVTAAQKARGRQINWQYFYRLLFTTDNLRLVHIVCHDKGSHDLFECDQRQVYVR